jgi:hypothetical protein
MSKEAKSGLYGGGWAEVPEWLQEQDILSTARAWKISSYVMTSA